MARTVYFLICMLFYAVINVVILVPMIIFISFISEKYSIVISKKLAKISCRFVVFLTGSKVEVIYKNKNIFNEIKDEPIILVSNHQSDMDAPLILGYIDKYFGFIAKKELEKLIFTSFWMKRIQCIFIDRTNVREGLKGIKKGAEKIKSGYSVAIFPEGTRSVDGDILEFKKGSFKLIEYSGARVLPVTIKGSKDILKSGEYIIRKANSVKIIIDELVDSKTLTIEENKNINEYIKNIIETNYQSY